MSFNVAINGFGRIGRQAFRQIKELDDIQIVAVNDLSEAQTAAYLLKYDSSHGVWNHEITSKKDEITVDGQAVAYFTNPDPATLPWKELGVDLVVDCSGTCKKRIEAQKHLAAGAKKVLLSYPGEEGIATFVFGVNDSEMRPEETVISAASCSTNALAPLAAALDDFAPIVSGLMLVVHGYTPTQMLLDNAQKKNNLRRSRAAAQNIIPTTAAAAKAVGMVLPKLKGKLSGSAIRVPVPVGCLVTLTAVVQGSGLTAEAVNEAMKQRASDTFVIAQDEIVSSDVVGSRCASIFDPTQTMALKVSEDLTEVRVAAWFDNEASFVSQMVGLISRVRSLNS